MRTTDLEDFDGNLEGIETKSVNNKMPVINIRPGEICNIFEDTTERDRDRDRVLKNLLIYDKVLAGVINEEYRRDTAFPCNVRNSFYSSGVPIHIKSGKELDEVSPKRDPSPDLNEALIIKPLGIFDRSLQSIFLAGDRIAEVATELKISYTNLAYIVRIHEIMHWLFQWKEKPTNISPWYEYIEESMANYMTLLWIDWLVQHINDCPVEQYTVEQYLLGQNLSGLKDDAIKFMEQQPEAYALAVPLYDICNPFKNNSVLPFLNWCFQKNSIKVDNMKELVNNLREFYDSWKNKTPASYSLTNILNCYKKSFA